MASKVSWDNQADPSQTEDGQDTLENTIQDAFNDTSFLCENEEPSANDSAVLDSNDPSLHFSLFDSDALHYRQTTQDSLFTEYSEMCMPSETLSDFGFGSWEPKGETLMPQFLNDFSGQLDISLGSSDSAAERSGMIRRESQSSSCCNLLGVSGDDIQQLVDKQTIPATLFPIDYSIVTPNTSAESSFDAMHPSVLQSLFHSMQQTTPPNQHMDVFSMLASIPEHEYPPVVDPNEVLADQTAASYLEMMEAPEETA